MTRTSLREQKSLQKNRFGTFEDTQNVLPKLTDLYQRQNNNHDMTSKWICTGKLRSGWTISNFCLVVVVVVVEVLDPVVLCQSMPACQT